MYLTGMGALTSWPDGFLTSVGKCTPEAQGIGSTVLLVLIIADDYCNPPSIWRSGYRHQCRFYWVLEL